VTAVTDVIATFKNWLLLVNFDNADWIYRQWVQMIGKKWTTQIQKARNKATQGSTPPATDLG
jgi:hypothetical protein